jgi:hypothetical protein
MIDEKLTERETIALRLLNAYRKSMALPTWSQWEMLRRDGSEARWMVVADEHLKMAAESRASQAPAAGEAEAIAQKLGKQSALRAGAPVTLCTESLMGNETADQCVDCIRSLERPEDIPVNGQCDDCILKSSPAD